MCLSEIICFFLWWQILLKNGSRSSFKCNSLKYHYVWPSKRELRSNWTVHVCLSPCPTWGRHGWRQSGCVTPSSLSFHLTHSNIINVNIWKSHRDSWRPLVWKDITLTIKTKHVMSYFSIRDMGTQHYWECCWQTTHGPVQQQSATISHKWCSDTIQRTHIKCPLSVGCTEEYFILHTHIQQRAGVKKTWYLCEVQDVKVSDPVSNGWTDRWEWRSPNENSECYTVTSVTSSVLICPQ